jgi:hypothetical protein
MLFPKGGGAEIRGYYPPSMRCPFGVTVPTVDGSSNDHDDHDDDDDDGDAGGDAGDRLL